MKFVTASEMREIDRRAIEEFGIPSIVLMENAGIICAEEVLRLLDPRGERSVAVFAGKGNNGGDGFVTARKLFNKECSVQVLFFQKPSEMKPDPLTNFKILEKMKVSMLNCAEKCDMVQMKNALCGVNVIVDALFGIGLTKPIEEPFKTAIELMNDAQKTVVAVDIPSGLHADTGEVMGVCVRAKTTVTFGLPKKGFLSKEAGKFLGRVTVSDISIPHVLLN